MRFTVTLAETVTEALAATGEYRAGGTDVQARRRAGLSDGPLVDIHRLDELAGIHRADDGSLTLGALVPIRTLATDERIRHDYPGLAQAAGALATPQIRQMATLGGSLLQRTRCPYYRHPQIQCYKTGDSACPARAGANPHGVLFDLGPCAYPHPSTTGMALLASEAHYTVHGQTARPLAALYGDGSDPRRDHTLAPGDLLTGVQLPVPLPGERAAYFRAITRAEAEWPLVECLARLAIVAGKIDRARVAVGGVANIPLRLPSVEAALEGRPLRQNLLEQAAGQATARANPLPQTAYKATFLINTVLEALERAAQQ